jgi:hypothetical protein
MPMKPRRSLSEYKKDVGEARLRRKLKEAQNKLALKENGIMYMKSQQDFLMGCVHRETHGEEKRSTPEEQDNVAPMRSIIIDVETKTSEGLLHHKPLTTCGDGVVDNRLCGRIALHQCIG